MNDNDIVIVEAVRTPVGRFRGSLAGVRADHMGALVLNALLDRTGISADQVSDVVFGCVTQIGEQSANIARTALLSAGWPSSVPGMTIDRKCGSGWTGRHDRVSAVATGLSKCGSGWTGRRDRFSAVAIGLVANVVLRFWMGHLPSCLNVCRTGFWPCCPGI